MYYECGDQNEVDTESDKKNEMWLVLCVTISEKMMGHQNDHLGIEASGMTKRTSRNKALTPAFALSQILVVTEP